MTFIPGDTRWMAANFGISSHWTSDCIYANCKKDSYENAVDNFDVIRYADTLASIGARHCIFTLTHAQQYLAMPNTPLDNILHGRTTRRDMLGELIAALKRRDIRFIAYYNHSCNGDDDLEWKSACAYADGPSHDLDRFAENICGIVRFIAERYGDGIDGWWFDSAYSVDRHGPTCTVTCQMDDWQFPWEELNAAAKTGNRNCAVAVNPGIGSHFLYTEYQDFHAGETNRLDQIFQCDAHPRMADHRWICQDSPRWVFSSRFADTGFIPPQFDDAPLKAYASDHLAAGRMLTFNILTDRSGALNPMAVEQLRRIFN